MKFLEEAKEIFSTRLEYYEINKFNLVQIAKLVMFGRQFYEYLSKVKNEYKAFELGLSELQIDVLMETTRLNVLDLLNKQSDIEKFALLSIKGNDSYIHLN
jgi:hypothetical protein